MKKILLFTAILFASITMGIAQGQIVKPNYQRIAHTVVTKGVANNSATTELTVKLNSIQSISVNTSNVSLVYTTVKDYENGVKSGVIAEHLQVYSTGGYKVNVGYSDASDNNYINPTEGLTPDAMFKSINVAVTKKEGINVNDTKLRPFAATATNGVIISSDKGVFGETFDVEYQGASNYMNSIKGGVDRTYKANVIYTITPN